ncbi:MAG: TIGR03546 family protein [Treponema sp.]|nr:TIGR03546 family protein [Treponema sp.]
MLKQLVKLLKALNSNRNPSEIAHACCMGLILGFMPKDNALWFLVFVFFLFVRINKPCYLLVMALMSLLAWHIDPLFDDIGYKILTIPQLGGFFGTILEIPFVGFTRFNNSIVMGSLAAGIALYVPVFICIRLFVLMWRKKITPKFGDSAVMKFLSKVPILKKIVDLAAEKI